MFFVSVWNVLGDLRFLFGLPSSCSVCSWRILTGVNGCESVCLRPGMLRLSAVEAKRLITRDLFENEVLSAFSRHRLLQYV